jgi:hypothetical protein
MTDATGDRALTVGGASWPEFASVIVESMETRDGRIFTLRELEALAAHRKEAAAAATRVKAPRSLHFPYALASAVRVPKRRPDLPECAWEVE